MLSLSILRHSISHAVMLYPNFMTRLKIITAFSCVCIEGRKHDAGMLKDSQLLAELEAHAFSTTGEAMCLYGDPAYPHRIHLQGPFKVPPLTPALEDFNRAMSSVRSSVEWVFGDVSWVL